ncbi:TPA: arylsulfatase [Candidatus Latescibacteria bacterium]|nr:arylsulfatase [Candidatus Latescibacterota bacterium]
MNQPNIILIITDQQRFDTVGGWGYDHVITPNIDKLAQNGISFTQSYCPGATCVASRAAIFTGMYPHNTGVYSFQNWQNHRCWVQDLADAGYHCANIGKMHFTPRDIPGGFHDRIVVENPTNKTHASGNADDDWGKYMTLHGVTRPNDRNQTDPDWLQKYQGVVWHEEEQYHSDVFIGNSAVRWIETNQSQKPLFLEVGFTGPHEPWDPLPRHLEMYDDREVPSRIIREGELDEKPPQHLAHQHFHANTAHESQIDIASADEDDIARMRRHYYANITTVDEQVGRVMDALEARGYLDNSIVIFCSDHGELLGDHKLAYKWLMYDPIVHIPLIVRTQQTVGKPATVSDLVSLMDLGPTILEAAGLDVPTYMEGRSIGGYLTGDDVTPRDYVCCEDNYQIMFRTQTHKLVYYIGQEAGELYDLESDPNELHNLWDNSGHVEIKQQLLIRVLDWMAASNYWNSGYKREVGQQYSMRWPTPDDAGLHGGGRNGKGKPLDYL